MKKNLIQMSQMEENMIFPAFSNTIDIPADILLYLIMKNIGFDHIVTNKEIKEYQKALIDAHQQFEDKISETLAFYLPSKEMLQSGLFAEIELQDGSKGFELKSTKGKASRELQEYRLARLECFSLNQRPVVRSMFALAEGYYQSRMTEPSDRYKKATEPISETVKNKVLGLSQLIRKTFSNSH